MKRMSFKKFAAIVREIIETLPDEIKEGLEIHTCKATEEVLKIALNLSRPEEFMKAIGLKVLDSNAVSDVAN